MNSNSVTQEQIDIIFNSSNVIATVVFGKCLVLTCQLKNGFIIVESSTCADVANFDKAIGRDICIDRIKNKLWELEGYKLQCSM